MSTGRQASNNFFPISMPWRRFKIRISDGPFAKVYKKGARLYCKIISTLSVLSLYTTQLVLPPVFYTPQHVRSLNFPCSPRSPPPRLCCCIAPWHRKRLQHWTRTVLWFYSVGAFLSSASANRQTNDSIESYRLIAGVLSSSSPSWALMLLKSLSQSVVSHPSL